MKYDSKRSHEKNDIFNVEQIIKMNRTQLTKLNHAFSMCVIRFIQILPY